MNKAMRQLSTLPGAKQIVLGIISRRMTPHLDIRRLKYWIEKNLGASLDGRVMDNFFAALQRAGMGEVVLNKWPEPSRFFWKEPFYPTRVAEMLKEATGVKEAPRVQPEEEDEMPSEPSISFKWGGKLKFLEFDVPQSDVDKLIKLLQSLKRV